MLIAAALLFALTTPASRALAAEVADSAPAATAPAPSLGAPDPADAAPPEAAPPLSVTLFRDGVPSTFATRAATVGAFLAERGIVPTTRDAVSMPLSTALRAGANVAFRRALPVTVVDGGRRRLLDSSAATVGDLLGTSGITLAARDVVTPPLLSAIRSDETIRIVRVQTWVSRRMVTIPAGQATARDRSLATGVVRLRRAGRVGEREISQRFERRGHVAHSVSLVSRIVRAQQDRIVVRGVGRFAALARLARTGFDATVRLAGQAIDVIATAYSAACYGCSGNTASGARAGHGVVAVDPHLIPLGTRLFIPGYGRAVAGDTGGSIVGHRIDLGFNDTGDAMRFGRRPVTVYVLK